MYFGRYISDMADIQSIYYGKPTAKLQLICIQESDWMETDVKSLYLYFYLCAYAKYHPVIQYVNTWNAAHLQYELFEEEQHEGSEGGDLFLRGPRTVC